jgi:CO dehydrogenase/acetyl-CoA synthase epsilon subunit
VVFPSVPDETAAKSFVIAGLSASAINITILSRFIFDVFLQSETNFTSKKSISIRGAFQQNANMSMPLLSVSSQFFFSVTISVLLFDAVIFEDITA